MASWKRASWSGPNMPQPGPDLDIASSPSEMSTATNAWRTRKMGEIVEERALERSNIKRWDGAARACSPWDSLKRDPELWYRNGNCLVHLYKRGQSNRGPSFKVPFNTLLEAKCHPLISRYIARDVFGHRYPAGKLRYDDLDMLQKTNPSATIELYIPPPAIANRETCQRYYIAMRNFFAWVFRRSMVGEHLGMALVWLLNTMSQLRCPGQDNMGDLVSYLDEEGYLDMRNRPIHALALLHFAEYFQCKPLYVDALTHCTGMSDRLFLVPEYQILTSVTRKLIRQVKAEMDLKLAHAGLLLRNFLEDDLTEANTGLSSHGRAHLERFRSFFLAYFTTRLGFFPPGSLDPRNYIFEPKVYGIMRMDLDALYEFLVDKNVSSPESTPAQGQGTLQTLHGFDLRNKFAPLRHPLPLLPDIAPSMASRRISWLNKTDKLKPDQRLVFHSALMKATNKTDTKTLKNPLVAAYRKFEEDSIFWPLRSDRTEKLSQVDARKIRWILIYAVYQVVRSCTQAPAECHDTEGLDYHVAVNTSNLPPWREARRPLSITRKQTERPFSMSVPTMPVNWPNSQPSQPTAHMTQAPKPTTDYFAHKLKKRNIPPAINISTNNSNSKPAIPPRVRGLNTNFRHSLQMFNSLSSSVSTAQSAPQKITQHAPRNRSSYHEIVIQGYGNGTNNVFTTDEINPPEEKNPSEITTIQISPPATPEGVEIPLDSTLRPQPLSLRSPSASSTSSGLSANSNVTDASRASTVSTAPSSVMYYSASSTWPGSTGNDQLAPTRSSSLSTTPSMSDSSFKDPPVPLNKNGRVPPPCSPLSVPTPLQRSPSISSSVYSDAESNLTSSSEASKKDRAVTPPPELPRKNSRRKLVGGLHPCPLRIKKSPPTTQLVTANGAGGWEDLDMLPLPLSLPLSSSSSPSPSPSPSPGIISVHSSELS